MMANLTFHVDLVWYMEILMQFFSYRLGHSTSRESLLKLVAPFTHLSAGFTLVANIIALHLRKGIASAGEHFVRSICSLSVPALWYLT